jgi:hypothetical protein
MFTNKDLIQIEEHGLSLQQIYKQFETFTHGIPHANVITAASVGNGIEVISAAGQSKLIDLYETRKTSLDIVKFVPASGAATRMFKFLYQFLEDYDPETESLNKFLKRTNRPDLVLFLKSIKEFAFINEVRKKIRKHYPDYKQSDKGRRFYWLVSMMLEPEGLNFSNLPKGLIPFHKYAKYHTTAFEEQLYEAAFYASAQNDAYLHFTFSEKHLPDFEKEFKSVKRRVTKKTKTNFNISYSFQKSSTDTLAVDLDNKPFRDEQGNLVFRPSGHGALLDNLNDVDADIVFIKNIDNVVAEEYVPEIAYYKKLLAGKLLWLQNKTFHFLQVLEKEPMDEELIKEVRSFMWNELSIKDIPFDTKSLIRILDRPIRVCGVVKNTGEPGGGPFWVKNEEGDVCLQIVEKAQVDLDDPHKAGIVNDATHFNPVDIVCGLRNHRGEKFDLKAFSDPGTGFISIKYENGIPIKALELPGLWNGSMANWNTSFVEIPLSTFNPVKTVNDLLNKEHRPNA